MATTPRKEFVIKSVQFAITSGDSLEDLFESMKVRSLQGGLTKLVRFDLANHSLINVFIIGMKLAASPRAWLIKGAVVGGKYDGKMFEAYCNVRTVLGKQLISGGNFTVVYPD
jgi:hypothetical protein